MRLSKRAESVRGECECEMFVGLGKIWVKVAEDAGVFVEWKAR